jgi:hypothetical protein
MEAMLALQMAAATAQAIATSARRSSLTGSIEAETLR